MKCCIVGGGPAGIVLGYLLARAGVPVTVFEKHADFFRDFRGDTVHPSTLEVLHELGLLASFLKLPHHRLSSVGGVYGDFAFEAADFTTLRTQCKFIALMPQWDFLSFFSEEGRRFPTFDLRMRHEVTGLLRQDGRVRGVQVQTPEGPRDFEADLVIACDGRHSTVRESLAYPVREIGVPIDVLWFCIGRRADDPEHTLGNINYGRVLITINRTDYFQCGLIIRKGSFDEIRAGGLERFQSTIGQCAPYLAGRVEEVDNWDKVKLLSVQINRLTKWHAPGLLCIGDAAHAMSPVFGVGINFAIQDAVATANLLAAELKKSSNVDHLLPLVQRRRELPVRLMQATQTLAHRGLDYVFRQSGPMKAPLVLRFAMRTPGVHFAAARLVGLGFRPEHVAAEHKIKRRTGLQSLFTALGFAAAGCVLLLRGRRAAAR